MYSTCTRRRSCGNTRAEGSGRSSRPTSSSCLRGRVSVGRRSREGRRKRWTQSAIRRGAPTAACELVRHRRSVPVLRAEASVDFALSSGNSGRSRSRAASSSVTHRSNVTPHEQATVTREPAVPGSLDVADEDKGREVGEHGRVGSARGATWALARREPRPQHSPQTYTHHRAAGGLGPSYERSKSAIYRDVQ